MSLTKNPLQPVPLLLDPLEQGLQRATETKRSLSSKLEEIERELSSTSNREEVNDFLAFIEKNIQEFKSSVSKFYNGKELTPSDNPTETERIDPQTVGREWMNLATLEDEITRSDAMRSLSASFHCMSQQAKMCSLFLSVFPLYSVIEKKPLIYWWMGEGLVMKTKDKTAEEVGEQVFRELLSQWFIRPSSDNKSLSVNSFIVDPWIHRMLTKMAKENSFHDKHRASFNACGDRDADARLPEDVQLHLLTVFNVKEQYLAMKPEWLAKLKSVEVLHLGRWQHSVTHHIEVEDQKVMEEGLGSQKRLKYLSLRGISRIETLPASITKLISLQILDLRACHNLEKLPAAVSKLKNLTHLDVSECFLLESMPKGVDQLCNLQVLKGFVLGKAESKNSCKISDLAKLKRLRKLSIRVGGNQDSSQQQDHNLGSLDKLSALRILTILCWNVSSAQANLISLPPSLAKLDLQWVPFDAVPEWLRPSKLPSSLVKLYITGGKLNSLKHNEDGNYWKVEFLRLKYLKNLKIEEGELVGLFPEYQHLEKISCGESDLDITRKRTVSR